LWSTTRGYLSSEGVPDRTPFIGAALIALGVYYWVTPAGSLPSFFPGHLAGSAHKHMKHGLAALIVAIVCFLGAWMLSGKA
jgi:hypothetical protein